MASPVLVSLPSSFTAKKAKILADLSSPVASYDDASPKGSVDIGIVDLINAINDLEGLVTTSSCAGRISVFVEGKKAGGDSQSDGDHVNGMEGQAEGDQEKETKAGTGGKGGGGKWLYVSHDPFIMTDGQDLAATLGMARKGGEEEISWEGQRLVRFKFEPMILHVLTASLVHAQILLKAGLAAGFRESGAINLASSSATPMVAIRSMGLGLESIVGHLDNNDEASCFVPENSLRGLLTIANERFQENERRRARFWSALVEGLSSDGGMRRERRGEDGGAWEDKEVRRERLRREGLERSKAKKASSHTAQDGNAE